MKHLCAGDLRHRVRFEANRVVIDTAGDPIVDPNTGEKTMAWQLVAEVSAAKNPLSARELLTAQQLQSQVTTRFVIRYRDDIDASMRIVHNGVPYDIAGLVPDPDSGKEWITVPCTSGINAG